MTKRKRHYLIFLSLIAFLVFSLSPSHAKIKPLTVHDNTKIVMNDEADTSSLVKVDYKKVPFIAFDTSLVLSYSITLLLALILLVAFYFRRMFFTPIFYQSNYVISSP